jgi:two-component sensor histidine kinase
MFFEKIRPRAGAVPVVPEPPLESSRSLVPKRVVVISAVLVWAVYYVLITLRSLLIDQTPFIDMLLPRLVVGIVGISVTLLAWVILRRFDRGALWKRVSVAVVIMLPGAFALALVNQRAFASMDAKATASENNLRSLKVRPDAAGNILVDIPDLPILSPAQMKEVRRRMDEARYWQEITDVTIGRYFLLLAWAALYLALVNGQELQAAERREGEFRRAAKAAELRSLRYQINPHFLFNTLNSLSALVMTGKSEPAERMIQTLSNFYRRTLVGDPTHDLALADEIALQKLYLEIEAVRFPERLRIAIDVPQALADVKVPGMLLQPLVENSVKYAVAGSRAAVTISISAAEEYGRLVLIVADDGPGLGGPGLGSLGQVTGCGIGLANVRDRLAARFGSQATLDTGPIEHGYRTVLRLPLERGCA